MRNFKVCLVGLLLLLGSSAFSQGSIYQKFLAQELKIARIYKSPLMGDFNGDRKHDYALVLRKKGDAEDITLYIIYSSVDLGVMKAVKVANLPDTMDLRLALAPRLKKSNVGNTPKAYDYNGVIVYSNEYTQLFVYDGKGLFLLKEEKHIGP